MTQSRSMSFSAIIELYINHDITTAQPAANMRLSMANSEFSPKIDDLDRLDPGDQVPSPAPQ